jgi:hypothetical protein
MNSVRDLSSDGSAVKLETEATENSISSPVWAFPEKVCHVKVEIDTEILLTLRLCKMIKPLPLSPGFESLLQFL